MNIKVSLKRNNLLLYRQMRISILLLLWLACFSGFAQSFYFGNDLSYANQMEDCGGEFKEGGKSKDVYQIFADRGTNLVRVRLWVDPVWQNTLIQPDGVKNQYSDLPDVKETIARSKEAGMLVMLGFQISDAWADPGRQAVPAKWRNVAYDLEALKDSVYNYIISVLSELERDTLMPEFIKIGNETNSGILLHEYIDYSGWWSAGPLISSDWNRHAQLFNSAIQAVRDIIDTTGIKPKIALHCSSSSSVTWWYSNIINNGVTDFDIMGISYYYAWHKGSISSLKSTIQSLSDTYKEYDVMLIETGYLWTEENFDDYINIIATPDPYYLPVIPEKQLEYMTDITRAVKQAGGIGVVFWEPAWISTPCRTAWGQGSQHDHVVYFDPENTNFIENGGGRWMESAYYEDLTTKKVTFQIDMTGQDVSKGVYISGSWTGESGEIFPMAHIGNNIYYYYTYMKSGATGGFYFLNDSVFEAGENVPSECAEWNGTERLFTIDEYDTLIFSIWETCGENTFIQRNSQNQFDDFSISPNPCDDWINIRINSFRDNKELQIIDLNGTVLQQVFTHSESELSIDLSDFDQGIYIIKLIDDQSFRFQKFVRN
jgi:arabinogalactan endo-1,4-beta-galactosidase